MTIAEPINLGAFGPGFAGRIYPLPIQSVGNEDLKEQSLDAFEVGYTGVVGGRATVSASVYVNRTKNDILFTELRNARYTATNPPPDGPCLLRSLRSCRAPVFRPLHLSEFGR